MKLKIFKANVESQSFSLGLNRLNPAIMSNLLIAFQFISSNLLGLIIFLSYQAYATRHGVQMVAGCEGPCVFFGMLSGLFFLIQLRSTAK